MNSSPEAVQLPLLLCVILVPSSVYLNSREYGVCYFVSRIKASTALIMPLLMINRI